MLFAVSLSLGPAVPAGQTLGDVPIKTHLQYIKQMNERGLLLLGGPYVDQMGGLAVIQAQSTAEARYFVERNPTTVDGILNIEWLHDFQPLLSQPLPNSMYYVATYQRNPASAASKPIRELLLDPYLSYANQLFSTGKLILAGAISGDEGALLIFNPQSNEEMSLLIADNSALNAQALSLTSLRPWYLLFGGGTQLEEC